MAETTGIAWTGATWNPWHGCIKVSDGCKFCYMYADKARFGQDPRIVQRSKTTFRAPLKWNDPRLVFTCSWSDWFIEEADAWRAEAWEIVRDTPHTYQILTKRPERIAECLPADWGSGYRNVWLGVSVENQEWADRRIQALLETPAFVRFLSVEPLLGPVDLRPWIGYAHYDGNVPGACVDIDGMSLHRSGPYRCRECGWGFPNDPDRPGAVEGIGWLIIGGESGPGARKCEVEWVRDLVEQCRDAGVACFVKQLGANVWDQGAHLFLDDRKGGGPEEWPEDLRVRQFPEARTEAQP